jgi:hypothetical protein
MLDPAIGKGNRVGSENIAGSISRLSSVEGSLGVVILDSILVGVRLPGLSVGRSRGISRLGSIGRGRNWQGGRGRNIGSRSGSICRCRSISRGRPVGATGVGTSHSNQSREHKSLENKVK